ncbi:hypothetical protein [Paenibacillus chitinolyticus]
MESLTFHPQKTIFPLAGLAFFLLYKQFPMITAFFPFDPGNFFSHHPVGNPPEAYPAPSRPFHA